MPRKVEYRRYQYTLKTLSSLILSPRNSAAFYRGIDDAETPLPGNFSMLYPFYQYGEYDRYLGKSANYYIPGSSLKGALCMPKTKVESPLMMDDLPIISPENIEVRNLQKGQYLDTEGPNAKKQAIIDVFFPNVGVEMLKKDVTCEGSLFFAGDRDELAGLLKMANDCVQEKLLQMCDLIATLQTSIHKGKPFHPDFPGQIKAIYDNLEKMKKREDVLLLGGFKGLRHSILLLKDLHSKGALFVDSRTMLPHGLTQFTLQ